MGLGLVGLLVVPATSSLTTSSSTLSSPCSCARFSLAAPPSSFFPSDMPGRLQPLSATKFLLLCHASRSHNPYQPLLLTFSVKPDEATTLASNQDTIRMPLQKLESACGASVPWRRLCLDWTVHKLLVLRLLLMALHLRVPEQNRTMAELLTFSEWRRCLTCLCRLLMLARAESGLLSHLIKNAGSTVSSIAHKFANRVC